MAALVARVAILVVVVVLLYLVATRILWPRTPLRCATCRHCARLLSDGVICRFGDKEVFKNAVHTENCHGFEDDPRIPRSRFRR